MNTQQHSPLFSLSVTTDEQLRDCSLSFWWAPVSRELRVLSGYCIYFCCAQSTGMGPSAW